MASARILIVEDDPRLARLLGQELERAGHEPTVVHAGGDALYRAEVEAFDLILLDLTLPDIDGLEVARRLRDGDAAILMLTARGDVGSRVEGLYAGASDYLTKPFSVRELLARIHVQLRERATSDRPVRYGPLTLEPEARRLRADDRTAVLPEREYLLLHLLLSQRGRLFSREEIERRLYGADRPASNTVEVFVHNLRRKLAQLGLEDVIQTVRGKGYLVR